MALFNFGKKRNEEKAAPACTCGCDCAMTQLHASEKSRCSEASDRIYSVKVLGAGCGSCHTLYENVQEAIKAMGRSVEMEYITDMQKVMAYGVMSIPALVINEQVVSMGKALKVSDIEKLLQKL